MSFEIDYIFFFKEAASVFFNHATSAYSKLIDLRYIIILWSLINSWNYHFHIGRYSSYIRIRNRLIRIDKIRIFTY